jgi:hypothetical protein
MVFVASLASVNFFSACAHGVRAPPFFFAPALNFCGSLRSGEDGACGGPFLEQPFSGLLSGIPLAAHRQAGVRFGLPLSKGRKVTL